MPEYMYACWDVQTLLVSISRTSISTKILLVVQIFSLIIMTYLKMLIGIKSLNTKQFSARLSPPTFKLSSFIGVKIPLKKENNLWLLLIFVFVNPRKFLILNGSGLSIEPWVTLHKISNFLLKKRILTLCDLSHR